MTDIKKMQEVTKKIKNGDFLINRVGYQGQETNAKIVIPLGIATLDRNFVDLYSRCIDDEINQLKTDYEDPCNWMMDRQITVNDRIMELIKLKSKMTLTLDVVYGIESKSKFFNNDIGYRLTKIEGLEESDRGEYEEKLKSLSAEYSIFGLDNVIMDRVYKMIFGKYNSNSGVAGNRIYRMAMNSSLDDTSITSTKYKSVIYNILDCAERQMEINPFVFTLFVASTLEINILALNLIKLVDKGSDNEDTNYIGNCSKIAIETLMSVPSVQSISGMQVRGKAGAKLVNLATLNSMTDDQSKIRQSSNTKVNTAEIRYIESVWLGEDEIDITDYQIDEDIKTIMKDVMGKSRLISVETPYGYDLSQSFKAKYI